jgi:hypothetical protein
MNTVLTEPGHTVYILIHMYIITTLSIVLNVCETWSLLLGEENELQVSFFLTKCI